MIDCVLITLFIGDWHMPTLSEQMHVCPHVPDIDRMHNIIACAFTFKRTPAHSKLTLWLHTGVSVETLVSNPNVDASTRQAQHEVF